MSEQKNYYELKVPENKLRCHPATLYSGKLIENPHITLFYGFDPKYYEEIAQYVKYERIDWDIDIILGEVVLRLSEKLPAHFVINIQSPKLQAMFQHLNKLYPNQHGLIDGEYVPHITIKWLKKEHACYTISSNTFGHINKFLVLDI